MPGSCPGCATISARNFLEKCPIQTLSQRSQRWQLSISYKKCNAMFIGNLGCKASLLLDGNELAVVGETKDLGVIVDSHLTFGAHIDQMVAKAFVRSNLIHKCFVSRDVSTLVRAFVAVSYTHLRAHETDSY